MLVTKKIRDFSPILYHILNFEEGKLSEDFSLVVFNQFLPGGAEVLRFSEFWFPDSEIRGKLIRRNKL